MKTHKVWLLFCLILMSCTCDDYDESVKRIPKKMLYKITYEEIAKKQEKSFEKQQSIVDNTFEYSPGILNSINQENVIIDNATGTYIIQGELIIELSEGYEAKDLLHHLKRKKIESSIYGKVPAFNYYQVVVNDFNETIMDSIREIPFVENVYYHHLHGSLQQKENDDSIDDRLWHLNNYGIPQIWKETEGKGITIAFLDSGIDMESSAFSGRIVNPYSVITGSEKFQDYVYFKGGDITRVIHHGTCTAGIGAGSIETMHYYGVAPHALIMPIQVIGFSVIDERLITSDCAIIEGIARAIAFKADIINISLGTDYSHLLPEERDNIDVESIERKIRIHLSHVLPLYDKPFKECEKRNIIVVCSAGNDAIPAESQPLSAHPYTISVGAIDNESRIAGFSNTGEMVDCYAPGAEIYSIAAGNSLFQFSGTSFSSPYVAGMLALVRSNGFTGGQKEISNALKLTNLELRTSLFPEKIENLFYPLGFYNELGGNIEYTDTERVVQFEFTRKYKKYFIEYEDSIKEKLEKILAYYTARDRFYKHEKEANYAITWCGVYFSYLCDVIINDSPTAYCVAQVLGNAKLSQQQVVAACENIHHHDYFALITNFHNYRESLAELYKRIEEQPWVFNGNTLFGLDKFDNTVNVYETVKKYLEFIHDNIWHFKSDEGIACYILAKNAGNNIKAIREIILTSAERFNDAFYGYDYLHSIRARYYICFSLTVIGEKEGIIIALNALQHLAEKEHPYEEDFKLFQELINTKTRFGFIYNYLESETERNKKYEYFINTMKSAGFKNGIFIK